MYNSAAICAVSYQARALCTQRASKEKHRFIVGTCSLHDNNELCVLNYTEDSNHFEVVSAYNHPDQIWAVDSSPKDPRLVATSRQSKSGFKSVSLWSMPNQSEEDLSAPDVLATYNAEPLELAEVATFNQKQSPFFVNSIKWHYSQDTIMTIDSSTMTTWSVAGSQVKLSNAVLFSETEARSSCAAWDPHNAPCCAIGGDTTLKFVDTREMGISSEKAFAHDDSIRDVNYNPNKPSTLVTAGDDRLVKVWDTRNMKLPIRTLAGHSHGVLCAKYNSFHDQLIVSGGSDNNVNLWRVASCSSSPWIGPEDGSSTDPPDIKVRAMDQHEDTVYDVAWSPADAWVYCSLSYDGRAIVNHVPSTEKYKILL